MRSFASILKGALIVAAVILSHSNVAAGDIEAIIDSEGEVLHLESDEGRGVLLLQTNQSFNKTISDSGLLRSSLEGSGKRQKQEASSSRRRRSGGTGGSQRRRSSGGKKKKGGGGGGNDICGCCQPNPCEGSESFESGQKLECSCAGGCIVKLRLDYGHACFQPIPGVGCAYPGKLVKQCPGTWGGRDGGFQPPSPPG